MYKPITSTNEIVSLAVMLLMILALVASQADATVSDEVRDGAAVEEAISSDDSKTTLRTTIHAHITGKPLTISIDAVAGFASLRFVFD